MAWQTPKTDWAGGIEPTAGDFNRIEENVHILGKYDRAPGYGTATGTNAKSITLSPAPGSYYDGLCFAFKNATQNTGAVTINVNGLGAKSIKKPNGNDLVAGNLKAGSVYTVRYNGTNFILQGSDSSGNATPEHVLAGKTFSNDDGPDKVGTMPNIGQQILEAGDSAVPISAGYHNGTGFVKPKFAYGTQQKPESGYITGTVSGLNFMPRFVFIRIYGVDDPPSGYIDYGAYVYDSVNSKYGGARVLYHGANFDAYISSDNITITADGFNYSFASSSRDSYLIDWYAVA